MKYILKKYEEMLFALLRASLHERVPEESYFAEATVEDWWQCYRLAARQGVKALAWDGIVKLPSELMPPKEVKLSWATGVMKYEEVYKRYCQTADELSRLYAEHNISTMQMKGVGLSALYPIPSHREGGDIDIYTYSADTTKMSHEEANNLADRLMKDRGIEVDVEYYKHSNFYYKGIPIENHKCFLNVHESPFFAHADEVLHKYMAPTLTSLPVGEILTPSAQFNALFLSFHAARHFGSGLSLHHLCDWVVMINRYGIQMPTEITNQRFLAFVDVLTYLCNRYLGTDVEVNADDKQANTVLKEMLYPVYTDEVDGMSRIKMFMYKLMRMCHNHKLSNMVLPTSLTKRVWTSIIYHIRKPETIFQW